MAAKKIHHSQGAVLYRSETNKMLGGVCGGLGEVFDIDPTVVRVLFLVALFFGGSGVLLYVILWLIVPTKSKVGLDASDSFKENVEELKDRAQEIGKGFKVNRKNGQDNSKMLFGALVLALGVIFLLGNFGFRFFNLHLLWPILLIFFGIFILIKHERH